MGCLNAESTPLAYRRCRIHRSKARSQFNFSDRTTHTHMHTHGVRKGKNLAFLFLLRPDFIFRKSEIRLWKSFASNRHTFLLSRSCWTNGKLSYVRYFYLDSVFISLRFVRCYSVNKGKIAFLDSGEEKITFYLFSWVPLRQCAPRSVPFSFWFHLLLP